MADGSAPTKRRKMPAQKPGNSEQSVATPPEFIAAVEARFGRITWDLAASADNCVVRNVNGGRSSCFYSKEENSLEQQWCNLGGLCWLNPPFDSIADFAEKCVEEANPRTPILFLTPARMETNWFWKFIRPHAIVYALAPRLQFVGHTKPYPMGLIVSLFGMGAQGFGRWRWKPLKERAKR